MPESTYTDLEDMRTSAADALDEAAVRLHARAQRIPGGEKVTSLVHRVAAKLQVGAWHVRRLALRDIRSGLERTARRHPEAVLAAAAACGFLLGLVLRRRD